MKVGMEKPLPRNVQVGRTRTSGPPGLPFPKTCHAVSSPLKYNSDKFEKQQSKVNVFL